MNFKEFYEGEERRKSGTYVSAVFTKDTINRLNAWAEEQNFGPGSSLTKMDSYHCTIIYSRKTLDDEVLINRFVQYDCEPTHFSIFPYNENSKCVVMELKARDLTKIHNDMIAHGATHDYPDFKPHVTIAIDVQSDFKTDVLEVPKFHLMTLKIKSEPHDLNWDDKE